MSGSNKKKKMNRGVAIVSHAQTHHGILKNLTLGEMVFDTVRQALSKVGLTWQDIDSVCNAGVDLIDGKSISNAPLAGPSGSYQKDESKTEEDGIMAAVNGFARVASGSFDLALVYAATHGHTTDLEQWSRLLYEPVLLRPLGMNETIGLALQAADYMNRSGADSEDSARAVALSRDAATKNQFAHMRDPVTIKEVINSEEVCTPLHKLDYAATSDGAVALILASEEKASGLTDRPVWIEGIGNALDPYHIGRRNLSGLDACRVAMKKALDMAGLDDPAGQIDVFETSAPTGYHEMMLFEALSLCEKGHGPERIRSGEIGPDGKIKVNPSGGMLATNPPVTVGLIRLLEAYLQLSGQAHGHQVAGAKTALAHGSSGACMQSHTIMILSSEGL
jgi:acetyl-CoA C-acetyltransferase